MSYVKNIWVDQDVERPKTYEVTNNQDGSITLTDSFGEVTELGTPVNATNMNHIEDGIENSADVDLSNLSATGQRTILEKCYPVGSIYFSVNNVDPSVLFGFGTWQQIKDAFLLACGDTYNNASTGGASTVMLDSTEIPAHTHVATTDSTGAHTHARGTMNITGTIQGRPNHDNKNTGGLYSASGAFTFGLNTGDSISSLTTGNMSTSKFKADKVTLNASNSGAWTGSTQSKGDHSHTVTVENTGGGQAHENMPPYLAVNVWKRVA